MGMPGQKLGIASIQAHAFASWGKVGDLKRAPYEAQTLLLIWQCMCCVTPGCCPPLPDPVSSFVLVDLMIPQDFWSLTADRGEPHSTQASL